MAKRIKNTVFDGGRSIYPDALRQSFLAKKPYTALCADLTNRTVNINGEVVDMQIYAVMDLATGKIVAHCAGQSIGAEEICTVTEPLLQTALQLHGDGQGVILHTDRGSQFTSELYAQMLRKYTNVTPSMSRASNPKDNAVIERFWRTFDQLKGGWEATEGHSLSNQFDNWEQARDVWSEFISFYNNKHQAGRNMQLTPVKAEEALLLAGEMGVTESEEEKQFMIAATTTDKDYNKPAFFAVTEYRKRTLDAYQKLTDAERLAFSNKIQLTQIQQTLVAMQQNDITMAKGIAERFDSMQAAVIDAIQGKKPKRKRKPAPVRAPLTFVMQQIMVDNALSPNADLYAMRNTLAVIVLCGLGCRAGEVRPLKLADLHDMVLNKQVEVTVFKRKRKEIKVLSSDHASMIDKVLNAFLDKLKSSGVALTGDSYMFTAMRKGADLPLSDKHFNATLNKTLEEFSKAFNDLYKKEAGHLRSHSARIQFASNLIAADINLEKVRQLMGHDDIRSTVGYNRHAFTPEERMNALDQAQSRINPEGVDAETGSNADDAAQAPKET